MGNGKKKDELLELAQAALKQGRPKRRKLGVVEGDGSVTQVISEQAGQAPTRKAKVLEMKRKEV